MLEVAAVAAALHREAALTPPTTNRKPAGTIVEHGLRADEGREISAAIIDTRR